MTEIGTSRRFRPDPSSIGRSETWGRADAGASPCWDAIIVSIAGELDASNTAKLASYLERHSAVTTRLYVDLRNVTFFSTSGLAVLRHIDHQCGERRAQWRLLAGPAVRKVLRICGADDLPQLDTLDYVLGTANSAAPVALTRP